MTTNNYNVFAYFRFAPGVWVGVWFSAGSAAFLCSESANILWNAMPKEEWTQGLRKGPYTLSFICQAAA